MTSRNGNVVFDYRALRLLVGLIALALPFIVSFVASGKLVSISASYHTESRDLFVGMLFIVGAFMWAYNGHSIREAVASKCAAAAAIFVAIFPTSCDTCPSDLASKIHYIAAVILFSILVYFCFVPFRKNTKGKKGKKGRRSKIYLTCGWVMVVCMVSIGASKIPLFENFLKGFDVTYWGEAVALGVFGFAWIVAGKYFKPFVDKEESLVLFKK